MNYLLACSIAALIVPATGQTTPSESLSKPTPAKGPLRVHPTNPCYFTDGMKNRDGSLKAIYLAGSHHWNNLQDSGRLGGPLTNRFDYDGYLNRLASLNHNFVRLWAWEGAGNGNVHAAGGGQQFKAPFVGDSVLYLQRAKMPE